MTFFVFIIGPAGCDLCQKKKHFKQNTNFWKPSNFAQIKVIALAVEALQNAHRKWVLQTINGNLRVLSNRSMLFNKPLASFINNIIDIDRPNSHKTRLEVVCILFCLLKITSFRRPHNNFKTLTLPSKLQRETWQKWFCQMLDPLLFSDVFSCFSFSL